MKKKLVRITNRHIQNYLGERKIWPVKEIDDSLAFYLATEELRAALDSYDIEYFGFRRKL